MRNSKLFSAVCVAAFCASLIAAQAQDNPAQAAARAALNKEMNAGNAQPAQPAPPPSAVKPSGTASAKPSQQTNIVVVPHRAVPAQPAARPAATKPAPAAAAVQTTPAISDAEAQARARAALEQKMNELNEQSWATPGASATPQAQPTDNSLFSPPPVQISPNYPGKDLGLKPIQPPPLPYSATKKAQLQGLLERYKADQITPEQYQTARAKILAEP